MRHRETTISCFNGAASGLWFKAAYLKSRTVRSDFISCSNGGVPYFKKDKDGTTKTRNCGIAARHLAAREAQNLVPGRFPAAGGVHEAT